MSDTHTNTLTITTSTVMYVLRALVMALVAFSNLNISQLTKELVPLKQVVKLRRELSANDTSRHPKLLKIGPNHQCQ